jgi:hypothetical protein
MRCYLPDNRQRRTGAKDTETLKLRKSWKPERSSQWLTVAGKARRCRGRRRWTSVSGCIPSETCQSMSRTIERRRKRSLRSERLRHRSITRRSQEQYVRLPLHVDTSKACIACAKPHKSGSKSKTCSTRSQQARTTSVCETSHRASHFPS